MTSDLARRVWQHREGLVDGFTKKYGLKRLVYVERHDDIRAAIQRETSIKRWSRAWKMNLILAQNPDWEDLYERLPEIVRVSIRSARRLPDMDGRHGGSTGARHDGVGIVSVQPDRNAR